MKKTFLLIPVMIFLFLLPAFAQDFSLDNKIKNLCNQFVTNIYSDILEDKDRYEELSNFSEHVLYENEYGIQSIHYQTILGDSSRGHHRYEFFLSILKIDDVNIFGSNGEAFEYVFPILNLKVAGYYSGLSPWDNFDLHQLIRRHRLDLSELQQKNLPVRLFLTSSKEIFEVGEKIRLTVVLKNFSKEELAVDGLTVETLQFFFDGRPLNLGKRDGSSSAIVKFKLVEEATKEVVLDGLSSVPGEFKIFVAYDMIYHGVRPSASLSIKIIP